MTLNVEYPTKKAEPSSLTLPLLFGKRVNNHRGPIVYRSDDARDALTAS
jgi:hypothetical protein